MNTFQPRMAILPSVQRALWPRLGFAREAFILYGGTALALRLGHRASADFDFFSFAPMSPTAFLRSHSLLSEAEVLQMEKNSLAVLVSEGSETVKLSFFGGLSFKAVQEAELTSDGVLRVASLADLFATKLNTIYQRVEAKDYLDIHAILQSGLNLSQGLEYARQVYGDRFNAMLPLQALCYFEEPELRRLPDTIKRSLTEAVRSVR